MCIWVNYIESEHVGEITILVKSVYSAMLSLPVHFLVCSVPEVCLSPLDIFVLSHVVLLPVKCPLS